MKGLSSLLILKRLMTEITMLEHPDQYPSYNHSPHPAKPCHYFDLMIGTSAGG